MARSTEALSTTSVTEAGDDQRTGWYGNQPRLSPAVVSGSTFGQLFSARVNGQVYAQPLVSKGTLLIVTQTNDIYGLDPETGAERWHRNVGTSFDPNVLGCADLLPSIGVTGTPVIDSATNTGYFFAKTTENGETRWNIHAIDVATGVEKSGFPVRIQGTASNRAGVAFSATEHLQRPGLLLLGGRVYAAFGAHCDRDAYRGWIVGVSTDGGSQTLWAANSDLGAGIWQSGGGIVSDGAGRMFIVTGNGGAPLASVAGNQAGSMRNLGEAVVRVDVQSDGTLRAADFFAPHDAQALDDVDADFSAGGPVALPDSFGTSAYPRLLIAVGKQGYVFLLNRDSLGGIGMKNGADQIVSRSDGNGAVWSKPAVWPGDGGYIYVPTAAPPMASGGSSGTFFAYQLKPDASNTPTFVVAGESPEAFGFSSGRPVVTSNGTTSGTALVWILWSRGGSGLDAELRAYDAVPPANQIWEPRRSFRIGQSSKFSAPGVGDGRIYVGTRDGHVLGFGSQVPPLLTATPAQFGSVGLGSSVTLDVSITANQALTIQSVLSSSAEFSVGSVVSPALAAGATTTVPVTFRPTSKGTKAASLILNTNVVGAGSESAPLSGKGLAATAELTLSAETLNFGGTTVGGTLTRQIVVSNTGATPLVLQGFTAPLSPFSAPQLPASGTQLAPDGTLAIGLQFSPTALGNYAGLFAVRSSAGSANLPLSGDCGLPGRLTLTPLEIDYGRVAVAGSRRAKFELTNTGGVPITITKSKPPVLGAFAATSELAEGTVLLANETRTAWVAYTPPAEGSHDDAWILNSSGDNGEQQVAFHGTGSAGVTSMSVAGWQFNESASGSTNNFVLTDAAGFSTGTAFWTTALPSSALDISFDAIIGPGSGADGMALVLADAAQQTPTSVGSAGSGLGFAGILGIALGLDTWQSGADPSDNFVGLSDGRLANTEDNLNWLATATNVPPLRGDTEPVTRHVRLYTTTTGVTPSVVVVEIDGVEVIRRSVALPSSVYVGFSAGTGGFADRHAVSNVSIVSRVPSSTIVASVLGFESVSQWTVSAGSATSSSVITQGSASLGVSGFYYTELTSIPLANLGTAGETISFDIRPPAALSYGTVQFYVIAPSVNLYKYLGQRNLAGFVGGAYRTLSFPMPADVRAALRANPTDLRLKITVNAPRFTNPYLFDNIRFGG